MYHTRLMNVLWAWRASKKMFAIFFANTLNKEKKAVYLYPLKEGDVFYGIFYGYKRIKGNRFFTDYASVCRFSKKISKPSIRLINLNLGLKREVCLCMFILYLISLTAGIFDLLENCIRKF
ncbi:MULTISPECIES: DUF226 domain-containing protein [Borreliella]|uniref:DUF226 domain-containing protein n=2 Tax=Borreliella TaxID=64895 RepID=UPI001E464D6F|nr:DUF226 domain-containing protein [Borreliella bavariensis]